MNKLQVLRKKMGLSQEEIASKLNMTKQAYGKIELGKNNLHPKHWKKLAQILNISEFEIQEITGNKSPVMYDLDPKTNKTTRHVFPNMVTTLGIELPIISEAAAASCNPAYIPLDECINEHSEESTNLFIGAKAGDFVIRVAGTSMLPWYPPGTLLLLRPNQRIKTGQRVVAILSDGEIVFKIFAETKNTIALYAIDDTGKDFIFNKPNIPIRYMCLVISSLRDEQAIDKAMTEAGIRHRWEDKFKKLDKN